VIAKVTTPTMVTQGRGRVFFLVAAAIVVALVLFFFLVVPPAPWHVPLTAPADPRIASGALHVHTTRSDGGGTVDDVAAAAARAGLEYVVMTDHGDGRGLTPPAYRSGVLCIDGAEIGTEDGHLVAAGFREPEFPLGGEGRDAIDDIHRLGGIAIAAHPASPKPALAWRDWNARFDGLEWLNADAEWRDESTPALVRLAASYLFRPVGAVAGAFDRPAAALARFDGVAARRSLVAVAGHDAHARLAASGPGDSLSGASLPLPPYETVFRSFGVRAVLDTPLSGDAAADAAAVIRAIRHGRVYTAIDAVASPGRFSFTARSGSAVADVGGRVIPAGPIAFDVVADAPPGAAIVLLHDGRELTSTAAPRLRHEQAPVPGAYRVEVRVPGAPGTPPVPWILASPIHVGIPSGSIPTVAAPVRDLLDLSRPSDVPLWRIEHAPGSRGEMSPDGSGALTLSYQLGAERASSPFVALARPVRLPSEARALTFRASALRPMRISVQLRAPGGRDGVRWRRSVFVDDVERTLRVDFADMRPGEGPPGVPAAERVEALLFVVDTVHADPGTAGTVRIGGITVGAED
jgi:hypothetical protein